ncbi:hypothetical protein [Salinithrix halophila]|uniref:Uncharacterized protein n=1 Tax=Salinithrix halophila TaxID=1485204 RepID=A0ABV8JMF0_9BACL
MFMIGIFVVVAAILYIEVPKLKQQGMKKGLWLFSILLLFGTGLNIAYGLDLDIPNPLDGVVLIYKPLSDWIFGWLK